MTEVQNHWILCLDEPSPRADHLDWVAVVLEMGWWTRRQRSWHWRRCAWCNPAGYPPPIAGKFAPGPKGARIRRRRR